MIERLNMTKTINVSSDKLWSAISSIGGIDRWIEAIKSCRVEGEGVGALRILELEGGGEMKDRIEEINHETRRFRYARTESPFPISNYMGTVDVRDADGGRSELSWAVEFEVAEDARDDMVGLLTQVISGGISSIEHDLQ